jgi:hypothetical protein
MQFKQKLFVLNFQPVFFQRWDSNPDFFGREVALSKNGVARWDILYQTRRLGHILKGLGVEILYI